MQKFLCINITIYCALWIRVHAQVSFIHLTYKVVTVSKQHQYSNSVIQHSEEQKENTKWSILNALNCF
jgi:hypothetical protein